MTVVLLTGNMQIPFYALQVCGEFCRRIHHVIFANVIEKSVFSQVYKHRITLQLLEEIIDHQIDCNAVALDNYKYTTSSGRKKTCHRTKGWFLNCLWCDGILDWVALEDLKESHPVQFAKYATNNKISL